MGGGKGENNANCKSQMWVFGRLWVRGVTRRSLATGGCQMSKVGIGKKKDKRKKIKGGIQIANCKVKLQMWVFDNI